AACGQKHGVHLASGSSRLGANGAAVDQNGDLVNPDTGQPVAGGAAAGGGGGGAAGGGGGGGTAGSRAGTAGGTSGTSGGGGTGGGAIVGDTIVVGIHAPVTGAAPFPATAFSKGKDVYFRYLNDTQNGINGRKVQVVFQDD